METAANVPVSAAIPTEPQPIPVPTAQPTTTPAPAVVAPQPTAAPAPVAEAPPAALDLASLGLAGNSGPSALSTSDDGVVMMGLEDDNVKAYDFELYQGRKGQTDRLAVLNPRDGIAGARIHYKAGQGYFLCQSKFRMQGNQEMMIEQAPCCEKMDPPRKRFAALIIQYATDPGGNLMNPPTFALKVWRFSEDKYVLLRNVHKEFSLENHDIKVSCSEEKYQKLAISNTKEAVYKLPKFQAAYGEQINLFIKNNLPKLQRTLGKKISRQELLEFLGLATAPSMVSGTLPIADLSDLLPTT